MFLRLIRRYTSGEITAHFLTANTFFPKEMQTQFERSPA